MVRVAHAQPRSGTVVTSEPGVDSRQRRLRLRGFLVVLAEIGGHRALPAWVWDKSEAVSIQNLLDRPADDIWMTASIPEELAVRLVDAAGGSVTGVEIYPVTADPEEVTADTCAARIELGASHVTARLDQGLTLAIVAGAPVRVESSVMDRLAVPVPADDPAAPFRGPVPGRGPHVPAEPGERPRFEPRNMRFADGLDRWHLGGFSDEYSAAAENSCAILSSAVPEPSGSAALMQTVFADDFRGAPVVFRGEFRTQNVAGTAGLCLRILWRGKGRSRAEEHVVSVDGSADWWSSDEISALVPEDADIIQFGIVLTGSGQVWLRSAELRRGHA
jgi:bifunctional DNase/RNase